MRQLHVVALSEDGRSVLLASSKDAVRGGFRVALDARLTAAVRGELARPGDSGPPVSSLTPKEIQARLRSGESAAQIAAAAGVPVKNVERFSGPVEAERAGIVDAVRDAVLVRGRHGPSAVSLGVAVDEHLAGLTNLREDTVSWGARREDDGTWLVEVEWVVRGRNKQARWQWDPASHAVIALDPASLALAHLDTVPATVARGGTGLTVTTARTATSVGKRLSTRRATVARSADAPATGRMAAPMKKVPAKVTPAKKVPAKVTPAKKAPAKVTPAKRAPAKVTPAKKVPAKVTPAKKAPAKVTPAKTAPAKVTPAKTAPAKVTPAKKAPAKVTPAKKAPAKKAPVKVTPAKKAPAKVTPAKKAPAKKAPAKKAPAKKAPAKTASPATAVPAAAAAVPSPVVPAPVIPTPAPVIPTPAPVIPTPAPEAPAAAPAASVEHTPTGKPDLRVVPLSDDTVELPPIDLTGAADGPATAPATTRRTARSRASVPAWADVLLGTTARDPDADRDD